LAVFTTTLMGVEYFMQSGLLVVKLMAPAATLALQAARACRYLMMRVGVLVQTWFAFQALTRKSRWAS
jgi:hypothetical protein